MLPRPSVIPTSIATNIKPSWIGIRYEMAHQQRIILERRIADDIFRLIPPNERAAFREMLEIEFHGRELPDHEKRRAAERMWHKFLKYGWSD